MLQLLPNPDFLKWLLLAIAKARRELVLVNYLAALEERGRGPVSQVAAALAAAARRGVRVSVVLEGSKFQENYAFYRRLKDAGASVWMDTSLTFIHTKAVLIDSRVLCAGSHNLSAPALTSHHELSIATGDRPALQRFRQELERMTAQQQRLKANTCSDGVKLPLSALIRLKRAIAPQAYLLYLLLGRIDGGRPRPIAIDAPAWACELGLPASTASERVRIDAALRLMAEKLQVVKCDRNRGTVARISLSPLAFSPSPAFLPETFWKFGWHRRLSVAAIHLWLAGQAERAASPYAPWWRLTRDEIAGRYGFQKQLVNRAQEELQRMGLLEVLFETGKAPKGRYVRYQNYFRENPFDDIDRREARVRSLLTAAPRKAPVAEAMRLAHLVLAERDPERVAALLALASEAGTAATRKAAAAIARLAPNSTRRTFDYAQELLAEG